MARVVAGRPQPGTAELWWFRTDPRREVTADLALLSASEQARAARRRGLEATRFVHAHAALRRVAAEYEGRPSEPAQVVSEYGRPPRPRSGLHMSLSHSGDATLIAVATDPVGVDIETRAAAARVGDDLKALARLTLSGRENDLLWAATGQQRPGLWLRLWTRKEALLKARGQGLAERAPCDLTVVDDMVEGCAMRDLDLGDQSVGALALASSHPRVVWRQRARG